MTLLYPTPGTPQTSRLTAAEISSLAIERAGGRDRGGVQARDARVARRALWSAAALMAVRATVVPPLLRQITAGLPASERVQFDAYTDPASALAAAGLAVVFILAGVLACRKPFLASMLAILVFVAASVPFVMARPMLVGGGHLGRITVLLILGRAATAGFAARFR